MLRGTWVFALGLMLLAGCGSGRSESVAPIANPVRVDVLNQYALPVEVFAAGAGISHRLGTVHPGMHGQFVVPAALLVVGTVEFRAVPADNAPVYRSGAHQLVPGMFVDVVITPQLFNSTVSIRQ